MIRGVEDGIIVKIFYESRIAKLGLLENLKPKVDTEYEEITGKSKRKSSRLSGRD